MNNFQSLLKLIQSLNISLQNFIQICPIKFSQIKFYNNLIKKLKKIMNNILNIKKIIRKIIYLKKNKFLLF